MIFHFIRTFNRKATQPAVCQTVSGSKSQQSISRGTGPTSQKGCDGSEKTTPQNKVLRIEWLEYIEMYVVPQRTQLIISPYPLIQWGGVARAHREKIKQQRDVSINPGSASPHAQPLPNGHERSNRANCTYRWTRRGTAYPKCTHFIAIR